MGCRVKWPEWTAVWNWPFWNGNKSEAAARATIRAFQSDEAKPTRSAVVNEHPLGPPPIGRDRGSAGDEAQPGGFQGQRAEQDTQHPH
ncbi:hypothetical protein O1611_g6308 [Lasiodiplodia mahajangana]|uniref:Uncharacterized protein n=1 Tax=Lasiodiplodia mahajangana TaxID=1108764 RepID=A0ACC2JJF1_9PEZI|nr:hypothetical protein O1611_g6308 [Lasiodiplodia mahajangana]